MGFLAPAIPAIGSLVGGLFGGGSGSKAQGPAHGQVGGTYNQLINTQGAASQGATGMLANSSRAFNPAIDYYTSILSGNPASVGQAIAPELNALRSGYTNAQRQVNTFAPMGGGRASTMANAPFQLSGMTTNLISNARNQAAQALPTIGSMTGNLGNSLLGTTNQAGSTLLGQMYPQQQMGAQQGGALGGGLFDILNSVNWGKIFGGGTAGGGGGWGLNGSQTQ